MAKKFIELEKGDPLYEVDIDWDETLKSKTLSYTVEKHIVFDSSVYVRYDGKRLKLSYRTKDSENEDDVEVLNLYDSTSEDAYDSTIENCHYFVSDFLLYLTDFSVFGSALKSFLDIEIEDAQDTINECQEKVDVFTKILYDIKDNENEESCVCDKTDRTDK